MDIIHKTVRINDVGSSEKQVTVAFDNKVDNAWATMQGFDASYSADHHVRRVNVAVTTSSIDDNKVTVTGTIVIKDDSNNEMVGWIDVLVVAVVEARSS